VADEARGAAVTALPGAGALKEVAALFLRLGSTAFRDPAVHVAMMDLRRPVVTAALRCR